MKKEDSCVKSDSSENVWILSLFTLAGGLFLLLFGVESVLSGRPGHGSWMLCCAVAAAVNYMIYRTHRNRVIMRNGAIAIMNVVLLSLVATGGVSNTGPLWLFIMPLLTFYICGLRVGTISVVSIYLLTVAIFFAMPGASVAQYSGVFKARFLGSLLLVAVMAFVLETSRQWAKRQLVDKIRQLEEKERVISLLNKNMEADLVMARELQMAMQPTTIPSFSAGSVPGDLRMRLVHRYRPLETVGGDFFHILTLSETRVGVLICDVMGHEVRSALITAMLRAMSESLRTVAEQPGLMLARINDDMCNVLEQVGDIMFTTAMYMVIDRRERTVRYARAGHHEALLMRHRTGELIKIPDELRDNQPALGIFKGVEYVTQESDLQPEDVIVLFTDGLFEVMGQNHEEFGMEQILAHLAEQMNVKTDVLFDDLINLILAYSETGTFSDDVCLVGIEISDSSQAM